MTDPKEKSHWLEHYSELVGVVYSIVETALKYPKKFPALLVRPARTRRKSEKKAEDEEKSSRTITEMEADLKITLRSLIRKEYHQISSMFRLKPDTEELKDVLKCVFQRLSAMLKPQKHPTELISKQAKAPFAVEILIEVVRPLKRKFNLDHPSKLEIITGLKLADDISDLDFAVTQTVDDQKKVVFFLVEVSKELPRHALVDCLYGLKELAKKENDKKVNLKSTRFGFKFKLISLLSYSTSHSLPTSNFGSLSRWRRMSSSGQRPRRCAILRCGTKRRRRSGWPVSIARWSK